jgi:hypothetical protein
VLSLALAALLSPRPVTDAGVWLDPVPAVAAAAFDVTGETQAPEGVLRVDLYVAGRAAPVASYVPAVPLGTVSFALRLDPSAVGPGRLTLHVVATTLVRGLGSDDANVTVPGAPARPSADGPPAARATRPAGPRIAALPRPVAVALPGADDSGNAFGAVAPVLPYAARAPLTPPAAALVAPVEPLRPSRSGPLSVAAGLLVLLVCSHLHRALRPDPRDGR